MLEYPPGWSCDRAAQRFEHYLLGTLALREALALGEHLEACEGCLQRLVLFRLTLLERSRG